MITPVLRATITRRICRVDVGTRFLTITFQISYEIGDTRPNCVFGEIFSTLCNIPEVSDLLCLFGLFVGLRFLERSLRISS